ncbi:BCLAF1 and THRAP3 family member 3 [Carassius gibelio]|uniref:BCLAF1 and THRAP3 family member 3 n=1 Tax=Carassius gibelio TaxID=101364 RepID=UPI002277F130|nr:BCLAF1 and THRAP3 family member 3 [Carassius gibelio]
MSRPRSRSPLYSRIPTLHGRRGEGLFDNQIHSSVQSDAWRNPEYGNKAENSTHWNKDSYQGEQKNVDHWASFIDAIEHAQKRGASPMTRYNMEGDEERPPHSPRRLPRERLPSPDHTHFGGEERYKMPTSGWNRIEGVDKELSSQHNHRESRDRSHPRHPEGRKHDRMDYGYHNEEYGNQYQERGSFAERSSKSDYREHRPPSEGRMEFGRKDDFVEHHRGLSPRRAPVIVEHDHGIAKRDSRNHDPPKMSGNLRSRDPPRTSETQRNRDRDRRDQGYHSHSFQDRHGGRPNSNPREESRKNYSSYGRETQGRERSRHMDQSRMETHPRDSEARREMDLRDVSDVDLRNTDRDSIHDWEEERSQRNHGRMMGQGVVRQRAQYHRKPNTDVGPAPRMDFGEQETLKIKVDMSRPVRQTSHLGYSSDRQLSLDLVNVGRQRLDFLPMLEHSGTYRESAVHSGTFAQEIITLVHQVKENYFRGQGITLNERFANEQYYSLQDEFKEEEEEEEDMGNVRPVMNRQHGMPSSETQIFCKIGPDPLQRRQLVPDPGDLRYDLERRRQQRLEGVKITIAGGNFAPMVPEGQESDPPYMSDDPEEMDENLRWLEQDREHQRQWDGPRQRMPVPNKQNFSQRGDFSRNSRPRGRRT